MPQHRALKIVCRLNQSKIVFFSSFFFVWLCNPFNYSGTVSKESIYLYKNGIFHVEHLKFTFFVQKMAKND